MVTVIASLSVEDFDTWFAEFQQMHPVRERHGDLGGRTVYRDADDPNSVVVVFRWRDRESARRYFSSVELAASVARAGGRRTPHVRYLEGPVRASAAAVTDHESTTS